MKYIFGNTVAEKRQSLDNAVAFLAAEQRKLRRVQATLNGTQADNSRLVREGKPPLDCTEISESIRVWERRLTRQEADLAEETRGAFSAA